MYPDIDEKMSQKSEKGVWDILGKWAGWVLR